MKPLRTVKHVIERVKDLQASARTLQYQADHISSFERKQDILQRLARTQTSIEELSSLEVVNNEQL